MEEEKKVLIVPSLMILVINLMTSRYREQQRQCVNKNVPVRREDKRKGILHKHFVDTWMKYLSESPLPVKKEFMKQLISQENSDCTIIYHISPVSSCINCYTSFDLIRQWENWHKPLFVEDNSFLGQIITRYVVHCQNEKTYDSLFDSIKREITLKLNEFNCKLRTISTLLNNDQITHLTENQIKQ